MGFTLDREVSQKPPYKDSSGRYRTASLFRENYVSKDKYPPIFSLKPYDDVLNLPSFKDHYLESSDPTGYTTAIELLGSWEHWEKLVALDWFQDHLQKWNLELEVKMKSEAIRGIIQESKEGKSKFNASKYVAEHGWDKRKAGRPTKEEIKRETKVQARVSEEISQDLERLGLKGPSDVGLN